MCFIPFWSIAPQTDAFGYNDQQQTVQLPYQSLFASGGVVTGSVPSLFFFLFACECMSAIGHKSDFPAAHAA